MPRVGHKYIHHIFIYTPYIYIYTVSPVLPCQKYCIYTVNICWPSRFTYIIYSVHLVLPLPKIPCIHRIHMALANRTDAWSCNGIDWCLIDMPHHAMELTDVWLTCLIMQWTWHAWLTCLNWLMFDWHASSCNGIDMPDWHAWIDWCLIDMPHHAMELTDVWLTCLIIQWNWLMSDWHASSCNGIDWCLIILMPDHAIELTLKASVQAQCTCASTAFCRDVSYSVLVLNKRRSRDQQTKSYFTRIFRVGHNHIFTVCIRYFLQGNHHIYGHIRCVYMVLANPMYFVS